jgi:hypothetical protein
MATIINCEVKTCKFNVEGHCTNSTIDYGPVGINLPQYFAAFFSCRSVEHSDLKSFDTEGMVPN